MKSAIFANDILKQMLLKENVYISIQISVKFVDRGANW